MAGICLTRVHAALDPVMNREKGRGNRVRQGNNGLCIHEDTINRQSTKSRNMYFIYECIQFLLEDREVQTSPNERRIQEKTVNAPTGA